MTTNAGRLQLHEPLAAIVPDDLRMPWTQVTMAQPVTCHSQGGSVPDIGCGVRLMPLKTLDALDVVSVEGSR
jgi:hypothetical protein